MIVKQVDLFCGQSAETVMGDHRFLSRWRGLHGRCVHATAFQGPPFVRSWYEAYRAQWRPVVVQSEDSDGDLVGLWLLAHDPITNVLAHAGTHQAEYHAWLSLPGEDVAFLSAAWAKLKQRFAFATLRFKYLPAAALGDTLQCVKGMQSCVIVQRHRRPLLNLDPINLKSSFAKKGNKSRLNRLKKLGKLEFRRLTDSVELARVLDDLIDYYDFRQGAVNGSAPFREDANKRRFHSDLIADDPNDAYVTVTYLDERPIAGFWGTVSGQMVHLGMLIFSPFLAAHSPGKLHIMQLSEHLIKEGKGVLDFTPGGLAWKERFANFHDEVAEATVYTSARARIQAELRNGLLAFGTRCASRAGITAADVRSKLVVLRRLRLSSVVRKISSWGGISREFRVYRGDRRLAESCRRDARVRCNSLSDLLSFEPGEPWQSRDTFLSNALSRLEHGETAYTVRIGGRLAHYGWTAKQAESYMTEVGQSMTFPPGSVALYDFYSHPDFRGQGLYRATIGHMLRDAFSDSTVQFAYISVLADNLPSRHVIESMGFGYQSSFFLTRRFGTERKWASHSLVTSETASA